MPPRASLSRGPKRRALVELRTKIATVLESGAAEDRTAHKEVAALVAKKASGTDGVQPVVTAYDMLSNEDGSKGLASMVSSMKKVVTESTVHRLASEPTDFIHEKARELREMGSESRGSSAYEDSRIVSQYDELLSVSRAQREECVKEWRESWLQPSLPHPDSVDNEVATLSSLHQTVLRNTAPMNPKLRHCIKDGMTRRSPRAVSEVAKNDPCRVNDLPPATEEEVRACAKEFTQLDANMWLMARKVAQDSSIPPERCSHELMNIMMQSPDSAWRRFYKNYHLLHNTASYVTTMHKRVEVLKQELREVREANTVCQALLSGDAAQEALSRIDELRDAEERHSATLRTLSEVIDQAAAHNAQLRHEAKEMEEKMGLAQSLMQELHLQIAKLELTIPGDIARYTAGIVKKMDQHRQRINPDAGAPSGPRCPLCLFTVQSFPFCPINGWKHQADGSLPVPPATFNPIPPDKRNSGRRGRKKSFRVDFVRDAAYCALAVAAATCSAGLDDAKQAEETQSEEPSIKNVPLAADSSSFTPPVPDWVSSITAALREGGRGRSEEIALRLAEVPTDESLALCYADLRQAILEVLVLSARHTSHKKCTARIAELEDDVARLRAENEALTQRRDTVHRTATLGSVLNAVSGGETHNKSFQGDTSAVPVLPVIAMPEQLLKKRGSRRS